MPTGRLRIEREAGHPERNVLVFVQCGRGFDAAYLAEPRAYDVLLNYYHESDVHPKADIAVVQAGTKTTAIRRLMELRPDLLLRYQAVLFLDDDVEIGAEGIEALFRAMSGGKARSCAAGAHRGFGHRLSVPEKTVRRRWRDAGLVGRDHGAGADAPRARKRATGHSRNRSAAGAATCFSGPRCARPSDRTASGSSARSPSGTQRRSISRAGAFYAFLRRYGVDPGHEANRIAVDFGVERFLRPLGPGEPGETCRAP